MNKVEYLDHLTQYHELLSEYFEVRNEVDELKDDIEAVNITGGKISDKSTTVILNALSNNLKLEINKRNDIMKDLALSQYNDRFITHSRITDVKDSKYKDLLNADLVVLKSGHIFTPQQVLNSVYTERMEGDSSIEGLIIEYDRINDEPEESGISHLIKFIIVDTTDPAFLTAPLNYLQNKSVWRTP